MNIDPQNIKNIKWQDAAILLAIAFLLGFLLAPHSQSSSQDEVREREIVRVRPDTVRTLVTVPMPPLHVRSAPNRARTVVLHDTLYREACLDTLLRSDTAASAPDTLSVCYLQDRFSVALGLATRKQAVAVPYLAHDTFYWREDETRSETGHGSAWYDDALVVILSLAAGIIVGKL